MRPSSPSRRTLVIAALASLVAFIVAERLITYHKPFETDVMIYAVFGHEMLAGRSLYVDLWDHKPPAIYIVFAIAELVLGYGRHTIFFLDVFVNSLTLVGIYCACLWGVKSRAAGLWGAAFWALLSGTMEVNAVEVNAEMFINPCNVWAFALLLRADGRTRTLVVGSIFALATFLKPFVIVTAILFATVHVAAPRASDGRGGALKDLASMTVPGFVGWLLHFVYFAAVGRFGDFWESVVTYNRSYAGDLVSNITAPLRGEAELMPDILAPLALLTLAALVLTSFRACYREAALLAAFIVASWTEIALSGRFYTHYYQLWMPCLIVGAAWLIGMLASTWRGRLRYAPHAVGAVVVVLLVVPQLHWYGLALSRDWRGLFHAQRVAPERAAANIAAEATARELDALLQPGETFYEWGSEPSLYFWSRRRPPVGILTENHLLAGPLAQKLSARALSRLESDPPEVIVVARWAEALPGAAHHPVLELARALPSVARRDGTRRVQSLRTARGHARGSHERGFRMTREHVECDVH